MKLPKKYQGITPGNRVIYALNGKPFFDKSNEFRVSDKDFTAAENNDGSPVWVPLCTTEQAADSHRLAAAVVELREALYPFADQTVKEDGICHVNICSMEECTRCGQILAAQKALELTKEWGA